MFSSVTSLLGQDNSAQGEPAGEGSLVPPLPQPFAIDPDNLDPAAWTTGPGLYVLIGLVVFVGVLIGVAIVARLLRRKAPLRAEYAERPPIAVQTLTVPTLPPSVSRVEVHGVPAQLVAVVLAPPGRGQNLPPESRWPAVLAEFFPRLDQVAQRHQTQWIAWPAQLAQSGFESVFYQEARLPGERGKGTPWFGMTGRLDAEGRAILVGLLFRGDQVNSLSELRYDQPGAWRQAMRIADAAPPPPPA